MVDKMTDHMWRLVSTGDVGLAVDFGVGVLAYVAAFAVVWKIFQGRDNRFFLVGAAALAILLYGINRDLFIIFGMTLRGFFMGAAPAIGWLSFGAIVLIAGAALGIQFARNYRVSRIDGVEAAPLTDAHPTVTQARATPLPKAQPEPARLTRMNTPPAVPVEYRRERVLSITDRRRHVR